jgi:hypothetical protein
MALLMASGTTVLLTARISTLSIVLPMDIALTDAQMSALLAASYPLPSASRPAFLEHCARELSAMPAIGDGAVHRVFKYQESGCKLDEVLLRPEGNMYGRSAKAGCLLRTTLERLQELREVVTRLETYRPVP